MSGTEWRFERLGPRRLCAGVGVAAATAMLLAGCGGSGTAGARHEGAVTQRSTSSTRTPVHESPATRAVTPRMQQGATASADANQAQARQTQPAAATAPSPTPAPRGEWRPAWWVVSPVREGGLVKVAAMADDADLLEARRKAVSLGLSDLRAHVDVGEDGLVDADTTIDVISLPDGRYRAFVLVEAAGR